MKRTEDITHIFAKTGRYKNGMGADAFLKELQGTIDGFKKRGWKNVRIATQRTLYGNTIILKGEKEHRYNIGVGKINN
jgi:hypothetical protein